MNKRLFIVHGWMDAYEDQWFPWLKERAEALGFAVTIPRLPGIANPKVAAWVLTLSMAVGTADEDTYFVGHSMGAQTILRYLASLPDDDKVGGAVFVAGWIKVSGLKTDEERATAKQWEETAINYRDIRKHLTRSVAIFSDNDPFVPKENHDIFRTEIGSTVILEHAKGHFTTEDGVKEVPSIVKALEGMGQI